MCDLIQSDPLKMCLEIYTDVLVYIRCLNQNVELVMKHINDMYVTYK